MIESCYILFLFAHKLGISKMPYPCYQFPTNNPNASPTGVHQEINHILLFKTSYTNSVTLDHLSFFSDQAI